VDIRPVPTRASIKADYIRSGRLSLATLNRSARATLRLLNRACFSTKNPSMNVDDSRVLDLPAQDERFVRGEGVKMIF